MSTVITENPVDAALRRCQRIFEKGTKNTTDVEWDEVYGLVLSAIEARRSSQPRLLTVEALEAVTNYFWSAESPVLSEGEAQKLSSWALVLMSFQCRFDKDTLEWAARWILDSLTGETNRRTREFGKNMAMTLRAAQLSPQPAPDAGGEWKTFGRIVHHPTKDERGDSVDRFQFEVENTNGLLKPGEAEQIAAQIVRDHSAIPKLIEALRKARAAAQIRSDLNLRFARKAYQRIVDSGG